MILKNIYVPWTFTPEFSQNCRTVSASQWSQKTLRTVTPENKVEGCVSQVYITADLTDGKVWYQGDSDAQLVKGLVALLIQGLNGLPPEEIIQLTPSFIEATGLQVSLTPSRANGFYNIFQLMKKKALALQLAQNEDGPLSPTPKTWTFLKT